MTYFFYKEHMETPTAKKPINEKYIKGPFIADYYGGSTIKSVWKKKGLLDEKEVEVWLFKEKRVDVFFLK